MKFRKKPVVIDAIQFQSGTPEPWPFGVVNYGVPKADGEIGASSLDGKHWVQTLEGPLVVSEGDWIIRGAQYRFLMQFVARVEALSREWATETGEQGRLGFVYGKPGGTVA